MDQKEEIKKLIQRYNELKKRKGQKGLAEISEANVRSDFIDDLFEILGWDIKNPDEYDRENYVRKVGYADVALKIDGKPVMFIEAKRFGSIPEVNRDTTDWIEEERQVMNYAASPERRIKWAILTNFEKLRVFNALNGLLILEIKVPWEYEERFEELKYLSKDAVKSGLLDRLETRRERPDIDERFLDSLDKWRVMLANEIYEKNKDNNILKEGDRISLDKLKSAVQRILDRLIVVRYAEDRLILDNPDNLKVLYEGWLSTRPYSSLKKSLMDFFEGFDKIHDSKLFEEGHICEKVEIGSEVLGEIIENLYDINFRKFDFDILGNTYETYLGHTLYFKEDGTLGLKPSQETRKESGIYYTPPYVVDYIVKNTVGEILKGKKPEEVKKIKVLDPACGSGSFLIKAFDYFKDYYEKENERRRREIAEKIKEYRNEGGNSLHIFDNSGHEEIKGFEKKILDENLHGVDLDSQAAEIASVNLMLKALKKGEKLPLILGENIKVGNSLISGSEEELKKYFGDDWKKKKPFNWEEEFPDVFDPALPEAQRGFDVIIGNPPYVDIKGMDHEEVSYLFDKFASTENRINLYSIFTERGLSKLKDGGFFGFIIPNSILVGSSYTKIRKLILTDFQIMKIVRLPDNIFPDAKIETIILIVKKSRGIKEENKTKTQILIYDREEKINSIDKKKCKKYHEINQTEWLKNDKYVMNIFSDEETLDVLGKIEKNTKKMADICDFSLGITPYDKYKGHTDEQIKNKVFHSNTARDKTYKKLLSGEDITRYGLHWNGKEWLSYGDWLGAPREPRFFKEPRILIRQIVSGKPPRIYATFTDEEYCNTQIAFNIIVRDKNEINPKFLLAIINSKLMNFYHTEKYLDKSKSLFQKILIINAKQFPIKVVDSSQQQPLIELADKMLSLNKQLNSINVDFGHYVDLHSRVKDIALGRYLENMGLSEGDKEVLNNANRIEGKVKEFETAEEGDWLVLTVGYEKKTRQGKVSKTKIRAFRCRIKDEKMRRFLYYSMKEFTTPGKIGEGNLYKRILKIKLPCFNLNWEKNVSTINDIMQKYLPNVEKWEKLKKEIEETDKEIDQKVYELYGLTEEEIKIVEGSVS